MEINKIYNEDCLVTMGRMEDKSIDVILTSPLYNKSRSATYSEESLATRQGHYKDFNDARSSEERSMISPDYARNFICDFILGKEQVGSELSLF